jgi:hypothetical protein
MQSGAFNSNPNGTFVQHCKVNPLGDITHAAGVENQHTGTAGGCFKEFR